MCTRIEADKREEDALLCQSTFKNSAYGRKAPALIVSVPGRYPPGFWWVARRIITRKVQERHTRKIQLVMAGAVGME